MRRVRATPISARTLEPARRPAAGRTEPGGRGSHVLIFGSQTTTGRLKTGADAMRMDESNFLTVARQKARFRCCVRHRPYAWVRCSVRPVRCVMRSGCQWTEQ